MAAKSAIFMTIGLPVVVVVVVVVLVVVVCVVCYKVEWVLWKCRQWLMKHAA